MAWKATLPRSLRSRGSVKDVPRHFVKHVMRPNTNEARNGAPPNVSIALEKCAAPAIGLWSYAPLGGREPALSLSKGRPPLRKHIRLGSKISRKGGPIPQRY